ncbi:MAG TPA: NAD(P)H-binding protein [Solirubrobacteraceae bacterium]|nr:NAD(P)H-binding protein [Solirubrobacteraceae bacterium]
MLVFQAPFGTTCRIFRTFPGLPDVLVTGATGAIGTDLVPRLLRAGRRVRAFARDPARVTAEGLAEVVRGDAVTGAGLREALAGVEIAYYLLHSMETVAQADGPFADRERRSADNFARAAARAGVRRIVYLGGLVPRGAPPSPHLASRLEVEDLLLAAAPEAVALRASIVIGARSRSFRFLVRLVERVPVMLLPDWRDNRTAPIDGRDVMAYLVAAGTSGAVDGPLSLDVGGPEVMTYGAMIERIRDAMLVGRPRLDLPLRLTAVTSRIAAAIAGEDPALIEPLMGSLGSDLLPGDERARELFGVRLHSFDAAVEHALGEWEAAEELAGR